MPLLMTEHRSIDQDLRSFQAGRREAFVPLWQHVQGMVYRLMRGPGHGLASLPAAQAEELALQVMEKMFVKLPEARLASGAGGLRAWVYTVALNHKRNDLGRKRERPFSDFASTPPSHAAASASPEQNELSEALHALLNDLDADERMLLELRVLERYDFERLARELGGEPPQTEKYKKQFYRLCAKARAALERRFGRDGF